MDNLTQTRPSSCLLKNNTKQASRRAIASRAVSESCHSCLSRSAPSGSAAHCTGHKAAAPISVPFAKSKSAKVTPTVAALFKPNLPQRKKTRFPALKTCPPTLASLMSGIKSGGCLDINRARCVLKAGRTGWPFGLGRPDNQNQNQNPAHRARWGVSAVCLVILAPCSAYQG